MTGAEARAAMRRDQVIHEIEPRLAGRIEIHRRHVHERDELEPGRRQRTTGGDEELARHADGRRQRLDVRHAPDPVGHGQVTRIRLLVHLGLDDDVARERRAATRCGDCHGLPIS